MNGLSLCAGIGGIDLGLHLVLPHYRTICYVEKEAYCQEVLCARMADGLLDRGALWDDVTTFSAHEWKGLVDIVHGGYPCQPFSVAGRRKGAADARHLWPDIACIIAELDPEWCFFENVAGHLTLGFDVVARDLETMGYRVAAGLFTAAEVGAPHRRQRLYILARRHQGYGMADPGCVGEHADESRRSGGPRGSKTPVLGGRGSNVADSERAERGPSTEGWNDGHRHDAGRQETTGGAAQRSRTVPDMGHADVAGLEGRGEPEQQGANKRAAWPPGPEERDRWARILELAPELAPAHVADTSNRRPRGAGAGLGSRGATEGDATQSAVRRVAHGLPHRVDRLKALGNAVVPDVAALAWRTLHAELTNGH